MFGFSFIALAFALVPSGALAVTFSGTNDWESPCTSGTCRHFAGDGRRRAYSSFSVTGPANALSDITTAAGWRIEGCSPEWKSGATQVRIVCDGTTEQMAHCAQLFDDDADDTIVRLPDNCGTGPFARVVDSKEITKFSRYSRGPQTHLVTLDYEFASIKRQRGEVSFSVTTSNIESTANVPEGAVMRRWSKTKMFDLPAISISEQKNLFTQSIDCPPPDGAGLGFSAGVSVDADVKVDAKVAFGFSISGSILPPKIKKMQILGSLNGTAAGDFTLAAHARGTFDIGSIPIYSLGMPGMSIPGIVSVGPSFNVAGKLRADVGVEAVLKAGVAWEFPNVDVAFPRDEGDESALANQVPAPIALSLDPKISATGTITAAIVPRLELGIEVLSGLAKASIFLDLEASATLDMTLEAHASVTSTVPTADPAPTDGTISVPDPNTAIALPVGVDASGGASGCASLDLGFDIRVGATGKLKPLFDKTISWDLFSREVELFNKCFGDATPQRVKRTKAMREAAMLQRRDFQCPPLGLADLAELISM